MIHHECMHLVQCEKGDAFLCPDVLNMSTLHLQIVVYPNSDDERAVETHSDAHNAATNAAFFPDCSGCISLPRNGENPDNLG